jgi:flagellar protein FlaH
MTMDADRKDVIVTGTRDLDEKLGGGIPIGSLCLVEGHSDAGKSVISQHLAYGALTCTETYVVYYTTENTVRTLIAQMDSLSLYTLDYFLTDRLRIYPLTWRSTMQDTDRPFRLLLEHFSNLPEKFKLVIVDSLTLLVAHSTPISILDFFSACKNLCVEGRSILLVAHSYSFDEEVLTRTRSLCDAHLRLKLEAVGDRLVKTLEVLKVRGADRPTGDVVSFEIEPKIGMRPIPLAKARV